MCFKLCLGGAQAGCACGGRVGCRQWPHCCTGHIVVPWGSGRLCLGADGWGAGSGHIVVPGGGGGGGAQAGCAWGQMGGVAAVATLLCRGLDNVTGRAGKVKGCEENSPIRWQYIVHVPRPLSGCDHTHLHRKYYHTL